MGAEDEQHPQCCYGNCCKRFDLRITNIYRKAAVNRQWPLLSESNQEVIKFCVQSKKLKKFYVEFILFFKKVLDLSKGGCYPLLGCSIFDGKGVLKLEHIEESRENEKNNWYMS